MDNFIEKSLSKANFGWDNSNIISDYVMQASPFFFLILLLGIESSSANVQKEYKTTESPSFI